MNKVWMAALSWIALTPALAQAELSAAALKSAKKATGLVVVRGQEGISFGSAFCVESDGIFATNHHVIADAIQGGMVHVVLDPTEPEQRVLPARILVHDQGDDLALIEVVGAKVKPLELGDSSSLTETMPITVVGFPFGAGLTLDPDKPPASSINTGRITSLRKRDKELELIQVDAIVNPGNSGGPMINNKGQVVGVVVSQLKGAGINFAVPSLKLKKMIETPKLLLDQKAFPAEQLSSPQTVVVRVSSLPSAREKSKIELVVGGAGQGMRKFEEDGSKGEASFTFPPLEKTAGLREVILDAEFTDGHVSGRLVDKSIKVGSQSVKLSQVDSIVKQSSGVYVVTLNGATENTKVTGLDDTSMMLGEAKVALNLQNAKQIRVRTRELTQPVLQYRLRLKKGSKVLSESKGTFQIGGDVALASRQPEVSISSAEETTTGPSVSEDYPAPPSLDQNKVSLKLPGRVSRVVPAGSGRYLLMHIKDVRKIGVFDVAKGEVSHYISLGSDDIQFAASKSKILVVLNTEKILSRYDLASGKKELAKPIKFPQIAGIVIGHASEGPALITGNVRPGVDLVGLLDPKTLEVNVLDVAKMGIAHWGMGQPMILRASPDGRTFAASGLNSSPSGVRVLKLEGKHIAHGYENDSLGVICPSHDGRLLLTSSGLVATSDLKRVSIEQFGSLVCFPSYHPSYFVGANESGLRVRNADSLSIYATGDKKKLLSLSEPLEEFAIENPSPSEDDRWFTLEQRIHYFPTANLLVTIGPERDALTLRHLDLAEELEKKGEDYLYVASIPPSNVRSGAKLEYKMDIRSKRGGVKCVLDSGPDKMKITPEGVIQWTASGASPGPVSVIVSVSDASGQEIYHTFTFQVNK